MTSRAPTVGLVVTNAYAPGHEDLDTPAVVSALLEQRITAVLAVWHDASVDWSTFDALVIRSPWDYSRRASEFESWLTRAATQTRVLNSPDLIRWNLNKRYLTELHDLGVPTVPTSYCSNLIEVERAVNELRGRWTVLKPVVSAGSRNTGLYRRDDSALYDLAARIVDVRTEVMVQPEVASLSAGAEKALFYFGGRFSHAIAKGPLLAQGGGFLSGAYMEDPQPAHPDTDEFALGDFTMSAIHNLIAAKRWANSSRPVYARLDVVFDEEYGPLLIEAELFEPTLYVHENQGAARRYAKAVSRELGWEQ